MECRTYTAKEVARILGLSMATTYRLISGLPHLRAGKTVRVPRRVIDQLAEEGNTHDLAS